MRKFLIKDFRKCKEVAFILIDGTMSDVLMAIAYRENRAKEDVSAFDHYEVCELINGGSVYHPVTRLFASDFARAW